MVITGSSRMASPSTVPSFRFTWLTSAEAASPSGSTAYPWFWAVIVTAPVRSSRTGWFAPRCPNGSLNVPAPSARAITWCPRQMPKRGTVPISLRVSSTCAFCTCGSPGPGDHMTPSGLNASTSSAVASIGSTVMSQFRTVSERMMLRFTPPSMSTTFFGASEGLVTDTAAENLGAPPVNLALISTTALFAFGSTAGRRSFSPANDPQPYSFSVVTCDAQSMPS